MAQQSGVIELGDGGEAFGEDFAVRAVRAEDMVIGIEQKRLANRRGFLADREMGRAAVIVFDAHVVAAELDLIEHRLKTADDHHVMLDAQQVGLRECA